VVSARSIVDSVGDPELPMLTLADLGVVREVSENAGKVVVTITPTYSGCPAMDAMRDDLAHALNTAGYREIEIRTALHPPWTTDWISETGKRKLAEAGIAPPGSAPSRAAGPVPLSLRPPTGPVRCPRCGSMETEEQSRFSGTACKDLRRCRVCREPFEHIKEI
jgi:ring-1,2-phenylacetyl-CoA epoxidase subunit PaaD